MAQTKTTVIVNLQMEGFHLWKDAKDIAPEVGFLASRHRHMFHICAEKVVEHNDRDVEFIMLKRDIMEHLISKFYNEGSRACEFEAWSCEQIAEHLFHRFELCSCSVLEDGENGAKISIHY